MRKYRKKICNKLSWEPTRPGQNSLVQSDDEQEIPTRSNWTGNKIGIKHPLAMKKTDEMGVLKSKIRKETKK